MNEKINELIKRYQDRLDNLLKQHNVSDVMDIDKVVHREEGRILRDIIKDLSEHQNKEKTEQIKNKMPTVDEGIVHCAKLLIERKRLVNIPTAYAFGFKDCLIWISEILEDEDDEKDWISKLPRL